MCPLSQCTLVLLELFNKVTDIFLLDIYGFNKNTFKPEGAYAAFRVNKHAINTFNTSSKEDHRRKRRIMAKGFSDSALASYKESISSPVNELIAKLLKSGKSIDNKDAQSVPIVFNWAHEANCLMLDIMGNLCFGAAFGLYANRIFYYDVETQ